VGKHTGLAFPNAISRVNPGGTLSASLSKISKAALERFVNLQAENEIWQVTLPVQSIAARKPTIVNQ
jgi:hypothetical protein